MKKLKPTMDQASFTQFKTRSGAGRHRDRREKRRPPRAVTKRRAWEVE